MRKHRLSIHTCTVMSSSWIDTQTQRLTKPSRTCVYGERRTLFLKMQCSVHRATPDLCVRFHRDGRLWIGHWMQVEAGAVGKCKIIGFRIHRSHRKHVSNISFSIIAWCETTAWLDATERYHTYYAALQPFYDIVLLFQSVICQFCRCKMFQCRITSFRQLKNEKFINKRDIPSECYAKLTALFRLHLFYLLHQENKNYGGRPIKRHRLLSGGDIGCSTGPSCYWVVRYFIHVYSSSNKTVNATSCLVDNICIV